MGADLLEAVEVMDAIGLFLKNHVIAVSRQYAVGFVISRSPVRSRRVAPANPFSIPSFADESARHSAHHRELHWRLNYI